MIEENHKKSNTVAGNRADLRYGDVCPMCLTTQNTVLM